MTTVMVVDDEVFIVDLYRDILKLKGFEVIATAYDGDEAIRKLSNSEIFPDIIILDHRMPEKSGIETMAEILEIKSDAKILFVSADIMVEKEAIRKGAVGFLPKPFRMYELVDAMNGIVDLVNKNPGSGGRSQT
ncbi:MAG TPA: response regulator [Euryarchaeota archaeon]|nr:response regulator [Euryarchaeota archaeon]